MIAQRVDLAQIWAWLAEVSDPESPVLSIVDLGIVRELAWIESANGAVLHVTLTPTYSGCPATQVIARAVTGAFHEHGIEHVKIIERVAPPWTTDWLTDAAHEKLRAFGISPPARGAHDVLDIVAWPMPQVNCPRCGSTQVELISRFGSTPCKALYRCIACHEPFDYFKCH